ncbi:MAG: response regulator [Candidatus Nanoarchaeia archaeon]
MERNNRIIVVDDQQDLCDQLAKLLLRSGKKNETLSLVQQMRAKLLGATVESDEAEMQSDEQSYIVDTALQGEQAFEMIKKANLAGVPYAVAFIDMRMPPGWDGMKTAKCIREIDKDIEIVIMTAYADHDQKQIADTVGTPEKLLYIKKPFQAEEIYQLALSLTSKWSLESAEKRRKKWLEVLLKGICKLKSYAISDRDGVYSATLKSIVDFTESKGGFILRKDFDKSEWCIQSIISIPRDNVEAFLKENAEKLNDCSTIRRLADKYLLPMKKDKFFAIAVVSEEKNYNDPEWYKLMCLYIMAVVEELSWREQFTGQIEKEKKAAIADMRNKILDNAKKISETVSADSLATDQIELIRNLSKSIIDTIEIK